MLARSKSKEPAVQGKNMPLEKAREDLKTCLVLNKPFGSDYFLEIRALANTWFNAYKDWEKNDKFLDAIREKRMCISQRGLDTVIRKRRPRGPGREGSGQAKKSARGAV